MRKEVGMVGEIRVGEAGNKQTRERVWADGKIGWEKRRAEVVEKGKEKADRVEVLILSEPSEFEKL